MKKFRFILAVTAFLCLISGNIFAQVTVDSRIQKLEETIQILERRVDYLENKSREPSVKSEVAPDKVNWRKLQKGMSEDDVKALLGSPTKINMYSSFAVWYYGIPSGGIVEFDSNTRTLKSWQEP